MEAQNPQTELLSEMNGAYDRLTEQELTNLGVVLGAYRSLRGNRRKHLSYVSMPITTGKRFYDILSAAGLKDAKEFTEKFGKDALWKEIIKPNIDEGIKFADMLGKRDDLIFIAPSVFEAKPWRWTEDAYMSLWYRVLGELAGRHDVIDAWEYSTGGVKEVFFSLLMQWRIIRPFTKQEAIETFGLKNFHPGLTRQEEGEEFEAMWKIRIYDSAKNEITVESALGKVANAVYDLHARGFNCEHLLVLAECIAGIPMRSPFFMAPEQSPTDVWNGSFYNRESDMRKKLEEVRRSIGKN